MVNELLHEAENRMQKAIESFRVDLQSIRTGRASPVLLDRIQVDYYGMPTPLQQIASISVPEAQLLLIKPYSKGDIAAIEKAIAASDLGLTPNNDGIQIRLVFPSLTEERRRDLTKLVGKRAEEARVALRNIRRDTINDLRSFEKESMISEDDLHHGQDLIQKLIDEYTRKVDEIAKDKEKEIMTI
jgi:ribosome recycling factor